MTIWFKRRNNYLPQGRTDTWASTWGRAGVRMGPVDNRVKQVIHVQLLPFTVLVAGDHPPLQRYHLQKTGTGSVSREMTSDNRKKTQDPK